MLLPRRTPSFEEWTAVSKRETFIEFEWVGIDNIGQLGIFSSVSVGYIPAKVFASYETYAALYNFLLDRQSTTTAQIISKDSGRKDFWRDWAQKGLIAYDYQDVHRTEKFDQYDLIAVPGKALLAKEVPEMKVLDTTIPRFDLAFTGDISFDQMREEEI